MSPVEPLVAHRLRVVLGRLNRQLRTVDATGLSWSQASILGRLDREGPMTAASLAAAEGVRPQSMAATIEHLEGEALVTRRPDERDRRQLLVSITEQGRAIIGAARDSRDQWLAQVIDRRFSGDDVSLLERSVELLERLASEEART